MNWLKIFEAATQEVDDFKQGFGLAISDMKRDRLYLWQEIGKLRDRVDALELAAKAKKMAQEAERQ